MPQIDTNTFQSTAWGTFALFLMFFLVLSYSTFSYSLYRKFKLYIIISSILKSQLAIQFFTFEDRDLVDEILKNI